MFDQRENTSKCNACEQRWPVIAATTASALEGQATAAGRRVSHHSGGSQNDLISHEWPK